MFSISTSPLLTDELSKSLIHDSAGALVVFEGWVRNHNQGKNVKSLEYQIYHELALKEGEKILTEAVEKFNLHGARAVHREGHLYLHECAIWIGATSSHRDDAFKATRYIIDEIKHRLPVWKKEHYQDEEPSWVFCRDHHHHVHFNEADYFQKQSKLLDQKKLKSKKVLVVGAGGLGCPVLLNLAAAGVGKLTVIDPDKVSITNIHRQVLYSPHLVGEKKALVAAQKLRELNPFIDVEGIDSFVKVHHINHDLVIDCTDNMETKYFLHDVCHKKRIPLISASVFQYEGQLRTFIPGEGCLRCLADHAPDDTLLGNCNDFGVIGATTSVLGSLQASEAIKFLNEGTNSTIAHTLYLNLKDLSQMKIKNFKKDGCKVCRGEGEILESELEVESFPHVLDIRNLSDEEVLSLKPRLVALCCHRGVRSKKLARILRSEGYEVFSLKGGACSR